LYYIAGRRKFLSKPELKALGLAHVTDDGSPPHNGESAGPDGKNGWLVADTTRLGPYQPAYRPDEQQWRKRPRRQGDDGPDIHVGYYRAAPPTPATLARAELLSGPQMKLADGNLWQVPLVRMVRSASESDYALPRYVDVDDEGRPIAGAVIDRYCELVRRCDGVWEAWLAAISGALAKNQERFVVQFETWMEDAAFVLGQNYRLDLFECVLLRLFTFDGGAREAADLLLAAVDAPFAQQLLVQKKTRSDGADST
jgi:hypothetical protein